MTLLRQVKICKNLQNHYYFINRTCWRTYRTGTGGVYGHRPSADVVTHEQDIWNLPEETINNRSENANVLCAINAFRNRGHIRANLDPLGISTHPLAKETREEFLRQVGFRLQLPERVRDVPISGLMTLQGRDRASPDEILDELDRMYCGTLSAEFMHISAHRERRWFAMRYETLMARDQSHENLSDEERRKLAAALLRAEEFDRFCAAKFVSVKRYSGEGCESMIALFKRLFRDCANRHTVSDIVIGMPHRGRLNLLATLLKFPPVIIFRKMTGLPERNLDEDEKFIGDVLSHLYTSVDLKTKHLHVTLLPNPSHLEAISPVVAGKARGKSMTKKVGQYYEGNSESVNYPILPIQVHGDGSFSGQGIIQETLNMSQCPHYNVGGSIHIIVNNQLGYTTPAQYGRSSRYCTDIMKMIDAPIIHVNGDDPEAVQKAARLAIDYRQKWHKDVAINLVCYRKWGHNELDDPTLTNPQIYDAIHSRQKTSPEAYADQVGLSDLEKRLVRDEYRAFLQREYDRMNEYSPENRLFRGAWSGFHTPESDNINVWDTGVEIEKLRKIGHQTTVVPEGFKLHKTLKRVLEQDRRKRLAEDGIEQGKMKETRRIDWALAEQLAIGSLLSEGHNVRISGQDVGRGTFSQRHSIVVDQETNEIYIPLNAQFDTSSSAKRGYLEMANSILSEEAVLGFEYGHSLDSPRNLVIWEAQFGDFFNGAQVIFDTLIASGTAKWGLQSGITILLPHGMDGAGPEHSSCRLERFLQMSNSTSMSYDSLDSDNTNWSVTIPTTPAQYFHVLRRQQLSDFRKPLIVASPKVLLRHPACVSSLNEMGAETHFEPVLPDGRNFSPSAISTLVLCSGKVAYTLDAEREKQKRRDIAILRIEEMVPFPVQAIRSQLSKYTRVKDIIWCQEEHENQGCWSFVEPRLRNQCGIHRIRYVGRGPLAASAVGVAQLHKQESDKLIRDIFHSK